MTRQEKYPTTKWFRYVNKNPKGRITGDCVIRAISIALGQEWEMTLMELAKLSINTGYSIASVENFGRYLQSNGWTKMPQLRHENRKKYTGKQFCQMVQKNKDHGAYILNMANHLTVCEDGQILDIWDCTGKTVGNYWMKAE